MAPRIAVVVSTKDRGHLIKGMISSVMNQTIDDWEIVIVQDRCTDFTDFIISTIADKRIKTFENGGIAGKSGALNFIKKYVKAPIVKFFDDDDILVPCGLEMYAQMMEDTDADMGYSARYTQALNNQMVYTPNRDFSLPEFLERPMVGTGSLVVKNELFQKIDYDTTYPASMDFDFICKCAMTGAKVAYTDLPLYIYRNHLDSITFDANPIQAMYKDEAKCRTEEALKQTPVSNELVRWVPPGLRLGETKSK